MKEWLVGTDKGMLLIGELEFTTEVHKATAFDNIGDAMRECIRLNNLDLGLNTKFKVIPM